MEGMEGKLTIFSKRGYLRTDRAHRHAMIMINIE